MEGTCEVWWARSADALPHHDHWLSPAERVRADRFRLRVDRDRFVVGNALLHAAVASKCNLDPADVKVNRDCSTCGEPHGSPTLPEHPGLAVSITHSGDAVGLAVLSGGGAIGIDVEANGSIAFTEVAALCLQPDEHAALMLLPASERNGAFLRLWTCKEAVLKATGYGLRLSPLAVTISDSLEHPTLLSLDLADVQRERVELHGLSAISRHVASLSVIRRSSGPRTHINERQVCELTEF